MPVIVIVLLALSSPTYLEPLYSDVRGLILDGLALIMLGSGVLIMNKMARFEI
jgi:Flp pilus assembly protein TadB